MELPEKIEKVLCGNCDYFVCEAPDLGLGYCDVPTNKSRYAPHVSVRTLCKLPTLLAEAGEQDG